MRRSIGDYQSSTLSVDVMGLSLINIHQDTVPVANIVYKNILRQQRWTITVAPVVVKLSTVAVAS
jgi:hypothetical protein